jgi:hypothetical protein
MLPEDPLSPRATKVYAAEIKQKNFIVFRTATVSNFVVGFRPGRTDGRRSRSVTCRAGS